MISSWFISTCFLLSIPWSGPCAQVNLCWCAEAVSNSCIGYFYGWSLNMLRFLSLEHIWCKSSHKENCFISEFVHVVCRRSPACKVPSAEQYWITLLWLCISCFLFHLKELHFFTCFFFFFFTKVNKDYPLCRCLHQVLKAAAAPEF